MQTISGLKFQLLLTEYLGGIMDLTGPVATLVAMSWSFCQPLKWEKEGNWGPLNLVKRYLTQNLPISTNILDLDYLGLKIQHSAGKLKTAQSTPLCGLGFDCKYCTGRFNPQASGCT